MLEDENEAMMWYRYDKYMAYKNYRKLGKSSVLNPSAREYI